MLKLIVIIAAIGSIIIESESKYCNGPHEYFEECVRTCDPQTCESIGKTYHCPFKRTKCEAQCRCERGYYRNKSGECIPKDQCDNEKTNVVFSTSNPNTESKNSYKSRNRQSIDSSTSEDSSSSISESSLKSMSTSGEDTIIVIDCESSKTTSPYITDLCSNNNGNGDKSYPNIFIFITVLTGNPLTPVCGPNEVYDDCINGGCGRRNCSQLGEPQICIDPAPGYCITGCRCKDNYLYDENEICVPTTSCPIPKCGENEVFDFCPANCLPDCDIDQSLILCLPSPKLGDAECNPSCRCGDNLYRTKDGGCVPKSQCPNRCPNDEVYEECPDTCIPNTCQSIWSRYRPCEPGTQVCKPSCVCPSGKYRNKIDQCITTEECLQCTKPNEYFSCGGECDNECDKLSRWNQTNCPIVNIQCNKKCYCEEGYARDFKKDCIPISECPPECPVNERYVNNTNEECRAKTCAELGLTLDCFQEGYDNSGSPGCVCIDDYVRNSDGICGPINECPSCDGDFNATSGCGTFCITCSNYQQKDQIACILSCKLNGCECRNEYVYDKGINKCLLPEDCSNTLTPVCGPNEVYDDCINGGCGRRNCSQLGEPQICIDPAPGYCIKGCRCKDNYLYDENETCVPTTSCPIPKCRENEVFDFCPAYCLPDCDIDQSLILCLPSPKLGDAECNPSCRCADKLYRTKDGGCVPKSQCPTKYNTNDEYVYNGGVI